MIQELGNAAAFLLFAAFMPIAILFITKFVRPNHPFSGKVMPYECGEVPVGSAYVMFHNRFYLVAIAFLIFDVELAMLFPVMVLFRDAIANGEGLYYFSVAFTFLTILFLGLIYEWKTGDLDWFQRTEDPRKKARQS